jgi:hypothetical protein
MGYARNAGVTVDGSSHGDWLTRTLRESGRHGADAGFQLGAQFFGHQMSIDGVADDLRVIARRLKSRMRKHSPKPRTHSRQC